MKRSTKNEKTYTELDYRRYMRVINTVIMHTEGGMRSLERNKKISSLSYDQWVDWQQGKLKIEDVK
jgi:hypothetical protein